MLARGRLVFALFIVAGTFILIDWFERRSGVTVRPQQITHLPTASGSANQSKRSSDSVKPLPTVAAIDRDVLFVDGHTGCERLGEFVQTVRRSGYGGLVVVVTVAAADFDRCRGLASLVGAGGRVEVVRVDHPMRAETQAVFIGAARYLNRSEYAGEEHGGAVAGIVFPFEVLWCGNILEPRTKFAAGAHAFAVKRLPPSDKIIPDPPPKKLRPGARPKPPPKPIPEVSHAVLVGSVNGTRHVVSLLVSLFISEGPRYHAFTLLRRLDTSIWPLTAADGFVVGDGSDKPVCAPLMPRPLQCRTPGIKLVVGPHLCVEATQPFVAGEYLRPRLRERMYVVNFSDRAAALRDAFSDKPLTQQLWDGLRRNRSKVPKQPARARPSLAAANPAAAGCRGGRRNAVLTIASGYSMKKIEHLVATFLRFSNAACTVFVIFATNRSVYADVLEQYPQRVMMVNMSAYLPTMGGKDCGPGEHRAEAWYRWISQDPAAAEFGHFFMIDSRDVYFQRDPFDALFAMPEYATVLQPAGEFVGDVPEEFLFGSEDTVFPFFHHIVAGWVNSSFNKTVYDILQPLTIGGVSEGLPLINSGMMFGTAAAVRDFLEILSGTVMSILPWCIADQLILTLLYAGVFQVCGFPHKVVLLNPESTPFRNLPRGQASLRFNGRFVVNSLNETYAIVHQMDRYPEMWKMTFAAETLPEQD